MVPVPLVVKVVLPAVKPKVPVRLAVVVLLGAKSWKLLVPLVQAAWVPPFRYDHGTTATFWTWRTLVKGMMLVPLMLVPVPSLE